MMAKFTSNHPSVSDVLIIGGKDDAFTVRKGGYGPFHRTLYQEKTYRLMMALILILNITINITGQATINQTIHLLALIRARDNQEL